MPARKVKPSDGGACIEFAYTACVCCSAFPVKHDASGQGEERRFEPFMQTVIDRCSSALATPSK
ncbi:hypothetical protein ABB27_14695 [Stenotrophomonas terrae]|uniref:Uncharacterized protein n=2 Tax=Stenotrophomonas terrae TaxID=405446 RepID=A0A0R0C9U9_9GAMM|nr:hypothetical protein ABB27_14695 [Stenotrophomonas terrae]